jgi:lipocalin-like protein
MIEFSQQRWFFTSRAVICVVIFVCLLPLSARAQNDSIAKRFVGAWKLVSVEREDPVFPLGYDHPSGMIIYDASGWMCGQIAVKDDRKPFARGLKSGTIEEKAAAFDSYFAYYGTYTVDSRKNSNAPRRESFLARTLWNGQCPMVRVPGQ